MRCDLCNIAATGEAKGAAAGMQIVRANGLVLHCADSGPVGAPALVFSNSLGTDFRLWDRLLPLIADGFRAIRYDNRGHGLSEAVEGDYRIADLAKDLAGLLDALEVRQAVVVGLSVGGMIAQGLVAARPELVRALVLADTGHKIGAPELWNQRIAAVRAGGVEAIADAVLERWFSAGFRCDRADEVAGWRAMLTRTPVAGYTGICAAIRDADLTDWAKSIAVPTLCLCGTEDLASPPALVEELADLIPGASYQPIAGAGHLPCVEAPAAMAAAIAGFFGEHDIGR